MWENTVMSLIFFKKISLNFGESGSCITLREKGTFLPRTRPSTTKEWLSFIVFIILSTLACKLSMRVSAWLPALGYSTRFCFDWWSSNCSWFFSFQFATPIRRVSVSTDDTNYWCRWSYSSRAEPELVHKWLQIENTCRGICWVRSRTCWVCRWGCLRCLRH